MMIREDPTVDELALLWQHEEEDELQVHALKTAKVRHTPRHAERREDKG